MRLAAPTFLFALLALPCSAQTDLYLIALMGQSNMSGRGELSELPAGFPANPAKIWTFTNAYKWEPATEPVDSAVGQVDVVSMDRRAGVGPSLALADAFVSLHPNTSVGLIPCARGATKISAWLRTDSEQPHDTLFGSCVNRIKTVSPAKGKLRAVIFWQGGSDSIKWEEAVKWERSFETFVTDLRRDLESPNLPIIMVTLGTKLTSANKYPYWEIVRSQQNAVNIPGVTKIEADGFERKEDGIHFTTKGELAFGKVLAGLLPAP